MRTPFKNLKYYIMFYICWEKQNFALFYSYLPIPFSNVLAHELRTNKIKFGASTDIVIGIKNITDIWKKLNRLVIYSVNIFITKKLGIYASIFPVAS